MINGQGILGRCLISWPERLADQRLYKATDLTRDAKVQRYQQRITALLQKPWSLHKDGSLNPATLELTPRARRAWIDIHDTIECQSGEFGELAGVQPVASKAAANVLRIAGVLAMVVGQRTVPVTTMRARSIDGRCRTTPHTCASRSSKVSSASLPRRTA